MEELEQVEREITLQMTFTEDDLKNMRTKFDIESKEDLYQALWECVNTYLEM